MKNATPLIRKYKYTLIYLTVILFSNTRFCVGQNIGDFQAVASGNWGTTTCWKKCVAAGTWAGATAVFPPLAGTLGVTVTIPSTFTITVNAVTVNKSTLVISSGGSLIISSSLTNNGTGTLTNNGTITNNGTLSNGGIISNSGTINNNKTITSSSAGPSSVINNNGSVLFNTSPGTISNSAASTAWYFDNGSVFQLNYPFNAALPVGATFIPNATWHLSSTCIIQGFGNGTVPLGAANMVVNNFGNFTWNYPADTADLNLNGYLTSVQGSFTVQNTNSHKLVLKGGSGGLISSFGNLTINNGTLVLTNGASASGTANNTVTVNGNCLIAAAGAGLTLSESSGNNTFANGVLNCTGNFTNSGGILNLSGGTATSVGGSGTLNVAGNFIHTSGVIKKTGIPSGIIKINGTSAQTIESIGFTDPTPNSNIQFIINQTTAAGLCNIATGKTFTLNTGTTFSITDNPSVTNEFTIDGTFAANASTWTLTTGTTNVTSPSGMFINGSTANIVANSTATSLNFNTNSTYQHTADGGYVPLATWDANSTAEIKGIVNATTLNNGGQSFGKILWNSASQTSSCDFGAALFGTQSDYTVNTTGTGTLRFPDQDFTIGRDLIVQNASKLQIANAANLYIPASRLITITGNASVTGTAQLCIGTPNTTVASAGNKSRDYTFILKKDFTYSSSTPMIAFDQRTFAGVINNESYHLILNFDGGITQNYLSTTGAANLIAGTLTNEFITNNPYSITVTSNSKVLALSDIKYKSLLVNVGSTLDMTGGTFNLIHYPALTTANVTDSASTVISGTLDFGLGQLSDATGSGRFTLTSASTAELRTKHAQGIALAGTASGCILCLNRVYGVAANYTYNGSSSQVTGTGLPTAPTGTIKVSNTTALTSGGVTLTQTTTITSATGILNLNAGRLITSAANLMVISAASGVTPVGGQATSFVDGPIKKFGNAIFIFPTGDYNGTSAKWARIKIAAPSLATDAYTAEYNFTNPHAFAYTIGAGLNDISFKEYWNLTRVAGATTPAVTLYWEDGSVGTTMGSGINSITAANLHVAEAYGGTWNDKGSGGAAGTNAVGNITTGLAPTFVTGTLYQFTFASPTIINPLPIELISFTGNSTANGNQLNWSTASETNNDYFNLERSKDNNFSTIATIDGHGNSTSVLNYEYFDADPLPGINYYRLKQVDFNGEFTYSNVIALDNTQKKNTFVELYPNPSTDLVNILTSENITHVIIYNMLGSVVLDQDVIANNKITYSPIAKGIYIVKVISMDGQVSTVRFTRN